MNFSGPFDAGLAHDSPVSLGGERFSFDSKPGFVQHHASDSHVVVPDAHLLFSGNYMRIGNDLIISGDGQKFVVGNYFKGEARPVLATKDGATLAGHIVDALTGHVHYAQAAPAAPAGEVIGHVQKMSGSATVIRNGVSVELRIGDAVQKGDVVQTGSDSSIGMTFVDGSVFGMTSNARMVLNEMIFDPNGSSNSSLISLVQGTITFVAGQTAKNGNMRVETPVATMGIRGTAVLVEIGANDGPTKFSVLVEPDGHTGSYNLYDKTTGQLIGTVSQAGQVTYVSVSGIGQPPTAIEQLKTLADQEAAKALIQEVFKLYFPNYNPDANPKSQKTGFGSPSDNLNPFAFYKPLQDVGPPKVITIPGVGVDPVTGQPNPPRTFYNTKAQFSASSILSEQAFDSTVESFKISDLVHIDDPDIGNAPFYDTATPFVAGSAIIKSAVSTNPNLSAGFLSQFLHIDQNTGVITFDRLGFNFLGEGESVTFMIQVTSQSGPDVAHVIIPITITGDNDVPNDNGVPNGAPTIVLSLSDIIGAIKEDTLVTPDHAIVSNGTITFRDVDLTDGHQATFEFTSSTSGSTQDPISNPSLPGFGSGNELGTFTIDPAVVEDETDTINTGTVGWHFELNENDPTLQSLAEGQTITLVYTITITDEHGALVTQDVTITITGTNDAPVLTADTASVHTAEEVLNSTNSTVEDVVSGSLTFADVDLSDTHQASAELHSGSVVWSGGDYADIPLATRDALDAAMTAVVTEDNTDPNNQASVGWEFKLPDHLFDFLAHGETLTLVYDVTVTDDNGLSSTQQVTVVVGAANDKPVITVIDNGAAVKEDIDAVSDILKDTGTVTFTDADLTDTHTAHVVYNNDAAGSAGVSPALALALATALTVPASALAAGDHDFNWDFALDTNLIQYLAEGETITATYTITVEDNSNSSNDTSAGQIVTVVITGTNDAPTITSGISLATTEGDAPVVKDLLEGASDIDASDTLSVTNIQYSVGGGQQTPATPGGITILQDGHTINVDGANPAFDHLAAGATQEIVVSYDITDTHGATVAQTETITITGLNDRPVLAAGANLTEITEDQTANPGQSVGSFATGISDADDGALKGVAITGYTSQNGHWEYSIDDGATWSNFAASYSPAGGLLLASDDKVRFIPNGENGGTETLTYVAWDQTSGTHGQTANTALAEHWAAFSQDSQTASLTVTSVNDAPLIDTSNVQISTGGGNTIISGAAIFDPDAGEGFNISLLPDSGSVAGTLDAITYTPPGSPPEVGKVTATLSDIAGADDTVNFIFNVYGTGPLTMQGTSEKDVFFATAYQDTFVFAPGSNHDTITGFTAGTDKIDLHLLSSPDTSTIASWLLSSAVETVGSDTLLHLNGTTDTLLVKGVAVLNASDFILHA